jgi:hypothetical protein
MSARNFCRLPVVVRGNPSTLIGLFRCTDLVCAYDVALTRRASLRYNVHQVSMDGMTHEADKVIEDELQPGSTLSGKIIKTISWSWDNLVVNIRQYRQVLIPNGNTV